MAIRTETPIDTLQREVAQLTEQANRGYDRQTELRLEDARNRLMEAQMTQGNKATAASQSQQTDELAQAKKQILDYTAGRGDATMNDAMTNSALSRLQSVMSGGDAPYTDTVQRQLLAQQASGNATAEGTQAEQLRQQAGALGGSIADPSYQAKLRQLSQQRTSANASAQGAIATTAQLQNFGARQQATNGLLQGRLGQLGMANGQYNQAAGYVNQTTVDSPHQSAVTMPTLNFGQQQSTQPLNYTPPPAPPRAVYPSPAPVASAPAQQQAKAPAGIGMPPYSAISTDYTNQLMKQLMPSIMYNFGR